MDRAEIATKQAAETLARDKRAGIDRERQLEQALTFARSMLSVFMPEAGATPAENSTFRYIEMLLGEA